MGPKDVLDKLKWHPDYEIDKAKVKIVHRGKTKSQRTIRGENILELGSGFMKIRRGNKTVKIPYHRVLKIENSKGVIWRKES
ncbi:hypothetical protein AKJ54_00065 [candidate division MSBL1 archaeon SCGC-AAA382K21]|uniref:UPF0248 protein AKJ54_00065 n=1 Tax=candidate division MSBL1 archaeon SCGC-AAA382K21 TaxID=1698283 RepID=A0A133VM96_9EURY|nr:hypothetical protein AKJ54_00065 [candidate division MSBL1 archaeon SCGC-AAA382K21]